MRANRLTPAPCASTISTAGRCAHTAAASSPARAAGWRRPSRLPLPADRDRRRPRPRRHRLRRRGRPRPRPARPDLQADAPAGAGRGDRAQAGRGARLRARRRAADRRHPPRPRPLRRPARLPRRRGPRPRAARSTTRSSPSLRDRPRYRKSHWGHGANWIRHEVEGDEWFGFEGVQILPGTGAEILLVPLAGHTNGHSAVALQDRRPLAAALRRRLLPPRRAQHSPLLPAGPALLPEPQQRRPQAAPRQPGTAARAGRRATAKRSTSSAPTTRTNWSANRRRPRGGAAGE